MSGAIRGKKRKGGGEIRGKSQLWVWGQMGGTGGGCTAAEPLRALGKDDGCCGPVRRYRRSTINVNRPENGHSTLTHVLLIANNGGRDACHVTVIFHGPRHPPPLPLL